MKKLLILAVLLFAAAITWGQNTDLTGIWINAEEEVFFAFAGNMCFLGETFNGEFGVEDEILTYTFNNSSKTLELSYEGDKERFEASLSGNNLTLTFDNESLVLTKKTNPSVPAAIAGVWRGPRPWVFAFINDQVFIIDEDGDADVGPYKFSGNKGSFVTNGYEWEIDFTVNGNTLTASGDVEGSFTKR